MSPLPLFLYLPQWGDEPTLLDFIHTHWPFKTDPAGLLKEGDVILYLDGLNEMGAKGARKVLKLNEWLRKNIFQQVIITCRKDDYKKILSFMI